MAKRSTDTHGSVAAAGASPPPLPHGVEVEFAIGCIVNGVAYAKGQRIRLNEMVVGDLKRAGGILVGFGHPAEMRTADMAGASQTTDAAPRRSDHGNCSEMAGNSPAGD